MHCRHDRDLRLRRHGLFDADGHDYRRHRRRRNRLHIRRPRPRHPHRATRRPRRQRRREKRIDIEYDVRSQYATIKYYSDLDGGSGNLVMTATYTFDDTGRLTDLVYTDASSATLRDFEWVYNAAGWITSHDSDIASEDVTSYTYDNVGQLTGVDYASSTDESYTYDENGNRITANGDTYTTGDANQTKSDGTYTYIYDDNGNLQFRYVDADESETLNSGDTDITEYTWDNRNRLVEVSEYDDYADYTGDDPSSVIDYVYDMFNRRIARYMTPMATATLILKSVTSGTAAT